MTDLIAVPEPPSEPKLSARSYGVYLHVLTLPGGWFTIASLMETFTDKRDGLTTTVNELIAFGLVTAEVRYERNNLRRTGYRVVPR
ncbi:hypothetical protein ETD86_29985 [Nonomuraea turkmeniaca]|uniref:MarR family transcriptional regulator n=1 Tax=Nonomuraea turkmeniaca TaxID=103838 RepID=A0A5S4F9N1_9ACTN|nr:hypothetical protein [Nonomuraea turkmeniaca]TMR13798.1 hypothetical protein ETD86_29985 [Nonomuraea turkmeniaca]